MLSKELIAASTVPLVLSVLSKGESYGYQLIQTVRDASGGEIGWSEGMLYPVLHWMENQKMIESEWRTGDDGGRPRRSYRIPKEARKSLQPQHQPSMAFPP